MSDMPFIHDPYLTPIEGEGFQHYHDRPTFGASPDASADCSMVPGSNFLIAGSPAGSSVPYMPVQEMGRTPIQILPPQTTPVACSECGTTGAAVYYLKRTRGLYALLCFQNGRGCWERTIHTCCSFVTGQGSVCTLQAEFEVVDSNGNRLATPCAGHLVMVLPSAQSTVHRL